MPQGAPDVSRSSVEEQKTFDSIRMPTRDGKVDTRESEGGGEKDDLEDTVTFEELKEAYEFCISEENVRQISTNKRDMDLWANSKLSRRMGLVASREDHASIIGICENKKEGLFVTLERFIQDNFGNSDSSPDHAIANYNFLLQESELADLDIRVLNRLIVQYQQITSTVRMTYLQKVLDYTIITMNDFIEQESVDEKDEESPESPDEEEYPDQIPEAKESEEEETESGSTKQIHRQRVNTTSEKPARKELLGCSPPNATNSEGEERSVTEQVTDEIPEEDEEDEEDLEIEIYENPFTHFFSEDIFYGSELYCLH